MTMEVQLRRSLVETLVTLQLRAAASPQASACALPPVVQVPAIPELDIPMPFDGVVERVDVADVRLESAPTTLPGRIAVPTHPALPTATQTIQFRPVYLRCGFDVAITSLADLRLRGAAGASNVRQLRITYNVRLDVTVTGLSAQFTPWTESATVGRLPFVATADIDTLALRSPGFAALSAALAPIVGSISIPPINLTAAATQFQQFSGAMPRLWNAGVAMAGQALVLKLQFETVPFGSTGTPTLSQVLARRAFDVAEWTAFYAGAGVTDRLRAAGEALCIWVQSRVWLDAIGAGLVTALNAIPQVSRVTGPRRLSARIDSGLPTVRAGADVAVPGACLGIIDLGARVDLRVQMYNSGLGAIRLRIRPEINWFEGDAFLCGLLSLGLPHAIGPLSAIFTAALLGRSGMDLFGLGFLTILGPLPTFVVQLVGLGVAPGAVTIPANAFGTGFAPDPSDPRTIAGTISLNGLFPTGGPTPVFLAWRVVDDGGNIEGFEFPAAAPVTLPSVVQPQLRVTGTSRLYWSTLIPCGEPVFAMLNVSCVNVGTAPLTLCDATLINPEAASYANPSGSTPFFIDVPSGAIPPGAAFQIRLRIPSDTLFAMRTTIGSRPPIPPHEATLLIRTDGGSRAVTTQGLYALTQATLDGYRGVRQLFCP